jgi:hypothetical protein
MLLLVITIQFRPRRLFYAKMKIMRGIRSFYFLPLFLLRFFGFRSVARRLAVEELFFEKCGSGKIDNGVEILCYSFTVRVGVKIGKTFFVSKHRSGFSPAFCDFRGSAFLIGRKKHEEKFQRQARGWTHD